MIAADLLELIPDDDARYLALCHTLETLLHPAVAAVLAHEELTTHGPYSRPARPRRITA